MKQQQTQTAPRSRMPAFRQEYRTAGAVLAAAQEFVQAGTGADPDALAQACRDFLAANDAANNA